MTDVQCPDCGCAFDPDLDSDRVRLEHAVREHLEHPCHDSASYRWIDADTMYIELPHGGVCTNVVSSNDLPDPWYMRTVWCGSEQTTVVITMDTDPDEDTGECGVAHE